jgi:phosphomannomutase
LFLSAPQGTKVNAIYDSRKFKSANWRKTGTIDSDFEWIRRHTDRILKLDIISPQLIAEKKLRVVVDCVGGTAAFMAPEFFNRIGVACELINSEIGEKFPHPPEPTPENLAQLGEAVRNAKADIGFAFDPDSDRLAMVDETGKPIGEEYTLALGCRYILKRDKGPIAVNLSSSLINDFVAQEAGTKLYRTRVGERNVTEKLLKIRGVAGGEGNGGLIYPKLHWGRDAFMAAAVILQYLATSGKTIGNLAGELPSYVMLKTKVDGTRAVIEKKSKALAKAFPKAKFDRLDGIKIYDKKWWVQIRASNTEPIARLMAEAEDLEKAKSLIAAVKAVL